MKAISILFFAIAGLIGTTLGQTECTANGYLDCLEGIVSATSWANCADLACVCGQVKVETACWTSYCPNLPLDGDLQTQYSNACGTPAGQYGGDSAPATTTGAGAGGGGGGGGGSPTGAGQAPTATAGGAAGPASTSKAGGDIGVVVSGGGIMAIVLALLAYL